VVLMQHLLTVHLPQLRDEVEDLPQGIGVAVGQVVLKATKAGGIVCRKVERFEACACLLLDAGILVCFWKQHAALRCALCPSLCSCCRTADMHPNCNFQENDN
jgi:hypothetical protein